MTDPHEDRDDDSLDRVLDRGFEAAGDEARREDPPPAPSVIDRIGKVTGSRPKVSLRDAEQQGQTPMLKPLGPDDAKDAGKYVIQGELGHGGVGTVHRGHDQDLGRDVAMKFLHDKYKDEPTILHRFVEEAQIGGQLQHPGIVPVYDLGMVDGKPFFAMKLVKGQTLAKKLAERESPASDRRTFLATFEDVCQTLAYAHARGVVHRDLKPANIMIGSFGEVQVVDWGMGKVLQQGGVADEKLAAERQSQLSVIETVRSDGHGTQSVMGSVMGTPAYMPPEQARGDVEHMDERSDVFALGAILCEILTGQPPYVGESDELIAMAAMARLDDAHARLEACGAEPEMVELATRCLMPAPAARPKSAEVVAKAVHDHLAAVESRVHEARVEAAEAKVRAAGLKRTQTLGISLTAVIAAGLIVSLWFWHAADEAAENENIAKLAAVASAQEAKDNELRAVEQTEVAKRELARAVEIKRLISEMLQSVTPEQAKGADITLLKGILDTASKRLAEGAIEDELVAAELHALTGIVYFSIGLYPQAEQHLPAAVELRKRVLGAQHLDTLASMNELANLYSDQGRYAEAEPLLLQVLEIRKRVLGDEHPDTLASTGNLAILYETQGRYAEAEPLGLQALEAQKRVLGEEHPSTLVGMAIVAGLYHAQGRLAEAVTLYLQTIELSKRVWGEEHPYTLLYMSNVADLYVLQGRHAEAEPLVQQTLEIQKRVLGKEHPYTLGSMQSLAVLYQHQVRYAEAEPLLLETIEIQNRVLGEEHPNTLTSMQSLAGLYTNQGRYAEAEPLMLQALEINKRELGEEHPRTLENMGNLTSLYQAQGRYAKAATLGLQTLEIKKRVLGEEHPDTLKSMPSLARLYRDQGHYPEAATLYLQTLEIQERVLGEEHPQTLISMGDLATVYWQQGRYDEAETLYLQTVEISRRVVGEEHPNTLACIGNLGMLYLGQGRYAKAEPLFLQTLEIHRRVLGAEHPSTLASMSGVADLYQSQSRYAEAEPLYLQALEIMKHVLGEEHPKTLACMVNLGSLYRSQRRYAKAETLMLQTLEIQKRVMGAEHPGTLYCMSYVADLYQAQGRYAEAEPILLQVIEIQKRVLGEEHPNRLGMLTNLGLLYNKVERFEEAVEMLEVSLPIKRRVLGLKHPFTGIAIDGLATAYLGLGRTEDALPLQRERIALNIAAAEDEGASAVVLNRAAWALLTIEAEGLRDPERALGFAKRACALADKMAPGDFSSYLDTLARAQHQTGDTETAIEIQKRAIALMPEGADPELAQRLAEYEAALKNR